MRVFREGRLINSQLHTGNILSLMLSVQDCKKLGDPEQRYAMARFFQFPHQELGWAREDKVHVSLEVPKLEKDFDSLVNLSLDLGGDLYFTIWETERLKRAEPCEEFNDIESFVTSDPGQKLHHIGIEVVRIYYLNTLPGYIGHSEQEDV